MIGEGAHVDPACVHHRPVAQEHAAVGRHRIDALAGHGDELADRRQREPTLLGEANDGFAERMLGRLLGGGGQRQSIVLRHCTGHLGE